MSEVKTIKYGDIVAVSTSAHISSQGEACALNRRGQIGVSIGDDIIYGTPVVAQAEIDVASFNQAANDPFESEVAAPDMEIG